MALPKSGVKCSCPTISSYVPPPRRSSAHDFFVIIQRSNVARWISWSATCHIVRRRSRIGPLLCGRAMRSAFVACARCSFQSSWRGARRQDISSWPSDSPLAIPNRELHRETPQPRNSEFSISSLTVTAVACCGPLHGPSLVQLFFLSRSPSLSPASLFLFP